MKGFRHYVKLLVYFGEDGTKSIVPAKTKGLKAIYISFSALSFTFSSVTQVEYLGYLSCQIGSNLSGEAVASKLLKRYMKYINFILRRKQYCSFLQLLI